MYSIKNRVISRTGRSKEEGTTCPRGIRLILRDGRNEEHGIPRNKNSNDKRSLSLTQVSLEI